VKAIGHQISFQSSSSKAQTNLYEIGGMDNGSFKPLD
jgi:hypothetical protein